MQYYYKKGNYAQAYELLNSITQEDISLTEDFEIYLHLAQTAQALKKYEDASLYYKKVLQAEPKNKTALKNNNDCELCDYCVSRRGGKASKVKFNEAELKRVLNVLLKENGFEFEMYNIYFNSEDEETIYSLLNKCNRTVFFYIYRNEGVGKYRACMELPNEGCHTIWIEPYQNKKINSFRGEYSFLSNFYEAPVEYEGLTYPSSEAAYQAQKCADPKDREAFTAMNPAEAKKAGRTVTIREDWEDVKISVMTDIVRAKFEQNPDLAEKLIATKDAYLEEGNNWGDRVWGTVNGEGANNLGLILMDTRKLLRK